MEEDEVVADLDTELLRARAAETRCEGRIERFEKDLKMIRGFIGSINREKDLNQGFLSEPLSEQLEEYKLRVGWLESRIKLLQAMHALWHNRVCELTAKQTLKREDVGQVTRLELGIATM